MLTNNYEFDQPRGIIAGIEDAKGTIHITEGQHRMNAALEIFEETGDTQYVDCLIESSRKGINGRSYMPKGSAPRDSRTLPRRNKPWWEFW